MEVGGDGNVDDRLLKEKDAAEPCNDTAGNGKLAPSSYCQGEAMVTGNDTPVDASADDSTKIPEEIMRDVSEPRADAEGKGTEAVMMERDESGRSTRSVSRVEGERSTVVGEGVRRSSRAVSTGGNENRENRSNDTSSSSVSSDSAPPVSESSTPSSSSGSSSSTTTTTSPSVSENRTEALSSVHAGSEVKSEVDSAEIAMQDAARTIHAQKAVKSCVSTISKLLTALQKDPGKVNNRKHRMDNLAIKKFIVEVKGGLELMKAVGFCEVKTDKDISYLSIEESAYDASKVDLALALLSSAPAAAPEKEEKKAPAAKVLCLGGCGFWGDDQQDNYCSLCFKKKMTGQLTGPAASAAAPAAAAPAGPPVRCACGFFGQKQYNNMCSVCFHKAGGVIKKAPVVVANNWRKKFRRAILKLRAVRAFMSAPRLLQKVKTRCWKCNKKVGITGIECKCGFIFCGTHRYADEHNCQFDHKANQQNILRKHVQQVVSKKFETID